MATINAKQKGNRWELVCARILQPFFPRVATARAESKALDNLKVDLTNTYPFLFQCKHVERGLDPHKVLTEMPNWEGQYKVLLWKRNRQEPLVVMTLKDAAEVLQMLKNERII